MHFHLAIKCLLCTLIEMVNLPQISVVTNLPMLLNTRNQRKRAFYFLLSLSSINIRHGHITYVSAIIVSCVNPFVNLLLLNLIEGCFNSMEYLLHSNVEFDYTVYYNNFCKGFNREQTRNKLLKDLENCLYDIRSTQIQQWLKEQ